MAAKHSGGTSQRGITGLVVLALAGVLALGVGGYLWSLGSGNLASVGVAAVGGPFELVDQNGNRFGSKQLAGKPYVIFFGFTRCPDICPTSMLETANRLADLGPDAAKLNVVFVSVDAEHDTPALMKPYLAAFDERIIGLTGTAEEIAAVAKAFRVFYRKVPTSSGYTMDHTALVYLMDSTNRYVGFYTHQQEAKDQLAQLRKLIAR